MRLWNLGACVLALLVVSCGGETGTVEPKTEGTLRLPLVSPAPDGKMYKLVGATFNITGPQTVTLTDTSADTVQTTLLAGAYTLELAGTWQMERMDAPGTPVPAQLLSPNPLPFFVKKGETSEVRFLFKLPGEGTANVGIRVDSGGWISGTIQFTGREYPNEGPGMFDELLGKSVPFVISFESYTLNQESWTSQMYVYTGPTIVQFGGPPSESLARVAAAMKDESAMFSLRSVGNGVIEFGGVMIRDMQTGYELTTHPGSFSGEVDAQGYPLFQPFEVQTSATLRGQAYFDAVYGPADVNVSP
jgi:hypothetical protein